MGDSRGDLAELGQGSHLLDARLQAADRREIGEESEQSEEDSAFVAQRNGGQSDRDRIASAHVVDLHARHRRLVRERCAQRLAECGEGDDVSEPAAGERLSGVDAEDLASGGIDVDDSPRCIDGDEAGRQAARQCRSDALEIVGPHLLPIVEHFQLTFLRLQRGDRIAERVDQIRRLVLPGRRIAERSGLIEHLFDGTDDPRQVR